MGCKSAKGPWHIKMRLLTVQLLGVLLLCYQVVATLPDSRTVVGNDDDVGAGRSAESKVNSKGGTSCQLTMSRQWCRCQQHFILAACGDKTAGQNRSTTDQVQVSGKESAKFVRPGYNGVRWFGEPAGCAGVDVTLLSEMCTLENDLWSFETSDTQ